MDELAVDVKLLRKQALAVNEATGDPEKDKELVGLENLLDELLFHLGEGRPVVLIPKT